MPERVLDTAPLTDIERLQKRFGVLLDQPQAAAYLGVSIRTLTHWRELKKGPPFCQFRFESRSIVRYPAAALERYLVECMVDTGEGTDSPAIADAT